MDFILMSNIYKRIYGLPILSLIIGLIFLTGVTPAYGLNPDHYAEHSVLSEGRWARVSVSETGMHVITDATLRNLGFSDPSKVRVYGTGGVMEPEGFTDKTADDLPLLPSVHNGKGLVFFADNHISWQPNNFSVKSPYTHTINPYSESSYYFLSDRETTAKIPDLDLSTPTTEAVTTFKARALHEKDLSHYGESGRIYLGEDFRSTTSQLFNLPLTDNTGGDVTVSVRFGAKITGGRSWLKFKANGQALPGVAGDSIGGASSAQYGILSNPVRTIKTDADKLDLNIEYNHSGVIFMARLDYIEAFYTRRLALNSGELHFYGLFIDGSTLKVAGCSAKTVIWDITDRAHPSVVKYHLDGENALIAVNSTGYREFVAFNPDQITRAAKNSGSVANQDLHGIPAPDMLIISPSEYNVGAKMLADMHLSVDSLNVLILEPELIYNEFSGGNPDVTAFRKLLKMWHDRGGAPRYCLLMGKPSFDQKMLSPEIKNAGYKPTLIWQSPTGTSEATSFSCDDYIGMLDDVDPATFSIMRQKLYTAVGRLPVKNATEARQCAQKIIDFVTQPNLGSWRNKVMLIADDGDNSAHFNQAQSVYNRWRGSGNGKSYLIDRLYLDSYPLVNSATGHTYPQATARMMTNYNEGVTLTNYIGHASETGWGHEQLWTWPQIQNMANDNLTFIYSATCRFSPWDENGISAGETLMLNTNGGVVGMISTSRTVYISPNGVLNDHIASEWFKRDTNGMPRRLGDIYVAGKNKYTNDENKLRYVFMGDPAIRLSNITHEVTIDSIAGKHLLDGYAEVTAGSRITVSGRVRAYDGSIDTDFNGTLSLQLYDAETVIQTYGNGDTGRKEIYNDRKSRLANINTEVKGGSWKATFTVPMEISNNYSPALLSAYAWDKRGREANGYSESLYVYGYPDAEATDTIGPKIEYLRLNRADFENGGTVNTNPLVMARLSDPSGINVSDAGIGHKISLRLDNETPYGDVAQYFVSDSDGEGGGTITYPLLDVAPGHHTLTLEAWDNLNNSSRATIEFNVNAAADPYIVNLGTDVNPATSGVNFLIDLDQPNTMMRCDITVYDLSGRVVWENSDNSRTDTSASVKTYWNLCDKSGVRVPRGIYLYKARVETPQGTYSSKTNKLAVTAQ